MSNKCLDKQTQQIIYRSAITQVTEATPNHQLDTDGGESGKPTGSSGGSIIINTP